MIVRSFLLVLQVADPLSVTVDVTRPDQDILSYDITVELPDVGSRIVGQTAIVWAVRGGVGPLVLDFDDSLRVDSVVTDGIHWPFETGGEQLRVNHWGDVGDSLRVVIHYRGSPRDGLFIQQNVHGERTAFADNWPNRAHHWFPSEDHPSDKAFASFHVEVPRGWKAVANGTLEFVEPLESGRSRWHWRTEHVVPVYTMVIGAGPMTVTSVGVAGGVAQTLWTFEPDSAFAVDGPFRRVGTMVQLFDSLIGPFPFSKLAHVQSSTRFGGMENSGAIFYSERGYANRTMGEGLVAHETVHQWFGDAVTEADWHHLWLSEGFASYFNPVYFELLGEHDVFHAQLAQAKATYLSTERTCATEVRCDVNRPVIDVTEQDLFALLNRNNYQKGAWVLHMLRREVGDDIFFAAVRDFYEIFRDSVALTSDLLAVFEARAGRSLRGFFLQWLTQPGYPKLEVVWEYDPNTGAVTVDGYQRQDRAWGLFAMAVPVEIRVGGRTLGERLTFDGTPDAQVVVRGVAAVPEVSVDVTDVLASVTVRRR